MKWKKAWTYFAVGIAVPPVAFGTFLYAHIGSFEFAGWFAELKEWQGALGIYGGFLVAVSAALFNAALQRGRDDRNRELAAMSMATSISGQLMVVAGLYHTRHQFVAGVLNDPATYEPQGVSLNKFHIRVHQETQNLECSPADLSILPPELIELFYMTKAHILACEKLSDQITRAAPNARFAIPDAERMQNRFAEHTSAVEAAHKAFKEYGCTGVVPKIEQIT